MFAELLNMNYEVVGKLIDDSDISSLSVYAYAILWDETVRGMAV